MKEDNELLTKKELMELCIDLLEVFLLNNRCNIIHLIVLYKFYYFYLITNNQHNEKINLFIFNSINRCL